MAQSDLRIGVTPAGYDDIGAVLREMGYVFTTSSLASLARVERLREFDVVFINCAGECRGQGQDEAQALRDYVAAGGALYASDYAADYVAAAFGEYVHFGGYDGKHQTIQAEVVDVGLQAALGKTIQLTFDLDSWRTIAQVNKAQVHLTAGGQPILISFDYGKGHVVFTCFHNKKALSGRAEADLLRYLVLKPLTARAAAPAKEAIVLELSREYVFALSGGQTSSCYEYPAVGGEPLVFALSWQGKARCELEVQPPDGTLQRQADDKSPLRVTVNLAAGGIWRTRARATHTAQPNTPMHLLIGPPRPDQLAAPPAPPGGTLNIKVFGVTELPIKVLPQGSPPPLVIRRLEERR
jgi:hypothetical protein